MAANPTNKVMHGARAKVSIVNGEGKVDFLGIFTTVSWGLVYDVQPVFLLGRMGPDELVYTAQEPVSMQCSGFRVINAGAHKRAGMPNVSDLLTAGNIQIQILDRQTGLTVATVRDVRAVSYSTTLNARNLEEISVSYIGKIVDDEDTQNAEPQDSSTLP